VRRNLLGLPITWDYRGHGRSQVPDDITTATMDNHARDADAVLDALGVEEAVHLGFSMGVQVCFEYYRLFPEKVRGIVAVCGPYKHPYDEFFRSETLGGALEKVLEFGVKINKLIKPPVSLLAKSPLAFPMAKLFQVDPHRVKKEDMASYFRHIADIDLGLGLMALIGMNRHSAEDVLPKIDVPTLIIAGEKDTMTPLRHNLKMHELIPGSELTIIPCGTHAAPIENPHAINNRIELFLRDHFEYHAPASSSPNRPQNDARHNGAGHK